MLHLLLRYGIWLCTTVAVGRLSMSALAGEFVVDQRDPKAADAGPGNAEHPFLTISAAAQRAMPGDTVRVRAGVYRERITGGRQRQRRMDAGLAAGG